MDCWKILGIEETKEESEIYAAYRKLLPQFHPEEDAEGFRRLRKAFEAALERAAALRSSDRGAEGKVREVEMLDSPELREWLKRVEALYQDFGKRIQEKEWEELLRSPICQDLETQRDAGWALLSFLMDHFYLPQSCCRVMDNAFGWSKEEDELKRHFPEEFVDRFLENLEHRDPFRFDRMPLNMDIDYERYIQAYFALQRALWERKREEAEELLEELLATGIEHPDVMLLHVRHLSMLSGKEAEAWALAQKLYKTDKENPASRYWYLRLAVDMTGAAAASDVPLPEVLEEEICGLLELDSENPGYWQLIGDFLCTQNRLGEAIKVFQRAYQCSGQEWDYLQDKIAEVAGDLSRQMEADGKFDWETACVCWMARRYDKTREILSEIEPPEGEELHWLMMMAKSCHELGDYPAAWEHRKRIWESYLPEDRVLELYMDYARDSGLAGKTDEALELYREAEERFGSTPELAYAQADLLAEAERPEEAMRMCEKTLKMGFHPEAFNLRTALLFEQEAYAIIKDETKQVMDQGIRSAQVYFNYAKALHKLEEFEEAEEMLKRLDELTHGADVVAEEYAALCYDMERVEEALSWIEKALEKRDTPRRQYMKADYLRDLEKYDQELAVFQYLEEKGVSYYYTDYRMGRALEHLGRFEEAGERFRKVLKEHGDYGVAWDGLGDVLQKQKKWDEAAAAYEQGVNFGHLQAARDLCRLFKRLHRDSQAEEWLKTVLKKWPEDGSLLMIYSDILIRRNAIDEAVRCLNRYIELYPAKTGYGYREIAASYTHVKDLTRAEEYYQKSIDAEPDNARAWRLMGKFLANECKDQERALGYLKKAVELNADSTYGWMKLGEVYEALGNAEEAQRCYEQSLENYRKEAEKDPSDCCNYEGMADVLIHLGRLEEAEELVRRAFSLESRIFNCNAPFCYEGYEDLAKIEEKRGNLEKALEWMKQAGTYGTTDYYPKEIARLEAALKDSSGAAHKEQ